MLREEIDELRSAAGVARRSSPEPTSRAAHLASELSHSRTGSSPVLPDLSRSAWARRSVQIPPSSRVLLEHARNSSIASFMTSSSTAADISGLGIGPVGEKGGTTAREDKAADTLSPNTEDGRQSPNLVLRSSPSGGIGYVVNGVPKGKANTGRHPVNRSISLDRRRLSLRNFSVSSRPASMRLTLAAQGSRRHRGVGSSGRRILTSRRLVRLHLDIDRRTHVAGYRILSRRRHGSTPAKHAQSIRYKFASRDVAEYQSDSGRSVCHCGPTESNVGRAAQDPRTEAGPATDIVAAYSIARCTNRLAGRSRRFNNQP